MKRFPLLLFILIFIFVLGACTTIVPPLPPASPTGTIAPTASEQPVEQESSLQLDDSLPMDPAVRVGWLDNGLVYYIRQNDEPMNRAELWLVINAGSLLEDEDQLGLAHFLEHMLFNGTEHFEGMAIVDFFEKIGMEFGPDINAFTSFDETVYMLQVPTDDEETMRTAFEVLRDWAAYATISPEEVDKERGVIVEEWRLREESAGGRIRSQTIPFILADSRYAERMPIGDMDIVRTAPAETLRRFYETWYRPDLMALIAVGDFDVDEIETQITGHFADLAGPENAVARESFGVPYHEDTRFLVVTDPEDTITQIEVIRKREATPVQTVADFRDDLTTDLFYDMLNRRLDEIERQADAPFLSASVGAGDLVRPLQADFISALVEDDKVAPGLEALLTEVERVRRFGFTETELERSKEDLLRMYQSVYDERENINSGDFASQYLDNFLASAPMPSIEAFFDLAQQKIPEITLEEANAKAAALAATDNRVVYVVAPEKEDVNLPSEQDLAAIFESVLAQSIEPYEDAIVEAELIEDIPQPTAILSERVHPDLEVTEIELANGAHVLFKVTDFKDDEVLFTAISPGGSSLASDEDFPEATTIAGIVSESGVGDFDQTELEKLLTGKAVGVGPYIGEVSEGLSGGVSPEDLETLFQLINLYITAPREDENAFEVFKNQQRTFLINRERDPGAAMQDALLEALYGPTIRRGPLPLDEIEALDYERALEIYADRFADVGDFSFVFVGSFDPDDLIELSRTYLGTLPSAGREEQWRDVAPGVPDEPVEAVVYKGEGDRATVQLVFTGPFDPTPENRRKLEALEGVLDIVLREELREELAGVYSSSVFSAIREVPEPLYFLVVAFNTDPDRVDELVGATFTQIEQLQVNGPKAVDVEKVQAQIISNWEEDLEDNGFWLSLLEDYAFYGGEERLEIFDFEEEIKSITAEDIQDAARAFLRDEQYVKVVLYPEAMAAADD